MKVWSLLEMRPGFELLSVLDSEHLQCARSCPKVFICFNPHMLGGGYSYCHHHHQSHF